MSPGDGEPPGEVPRDGMGRLCSQRLQKEHRPPAPALGRVMDAALAGAGSTVGMLEACS